MKKLFYILIILFCFIEAKSQEIVKTSGILYSNGAPTTTPYNINYGSEIVQDTTTKKFYQWDRYDKQWIEFGWPIFETGTGGAPSFTPHAAQSHMAIHTSNQLYYYNSGWNLAGDGGGGGADTQDLSLSGDTLYLVNGGYVLLTPYRQTLSNTTGTLRLSDGGGSWSIPDSSSTNEIQTITISPGKGTIGLTSVASIVLGDSSATNELQTFSSTTGTVTLSQGGGHFTIPDSSLANEGVLAWSVTANHGTIISNSLGSVTGHFAGRNGLIISDSSGYWLFTQANGTATTIDTFSRSTNTISLSLSGDGEAAHTLTVIGTNVISSSGNTFTSTINGVANTGTGTIINSESLTFSNDSLKATINGLNTNAVYLGSYANVTQYVDTFSISGNYLKISLYGDNKRLDSVSLAPYLDNTDSQTLSFSSPNLSISGGNSVDLSTLLTGTTTNVITENGNTLTSIVNGVTGSIVNIINSNSLSYTTVGGILTISTNGISDTTTIPYAATSANGILSSTDWNTFNGKQASGNYITALTGDVTASGPGSAAATIGASKVLSSMISDSTIVRADVNYTIVQKDGNHSGGNYAIGTKDNYDFLINAHDTLVGNFSVHDAIRNGQLSIGTVNPLVIDFNGIKNTTTQSINIDATSSGTIDLIGISVFENYLSLVEQSAPGTPASGRGRLYEKTDNKLYFKNDAGVETEVTNAAGGSASYATVTSGTVPDQYYQKVIPGQYFYQGYFPSFPTINYDGKEQGFYNAPFGGTPGAANIVGIIAGDSITGRISNIELLDTLLSITQSGSTGYVGAYYGNNYINQYAATIGRQSFQNIYIDSITQNTSQINLYTDTVNIKRTNTYFKFSKDQVVAFGTSHFFPTTGANSDKMLLFYADGIALTNDDQTQNLEEGIFLGQDNIFLETYGVSGGTTINMDTTQFLFTLDAATSTHLRLKIDSTFFDGKKLRFKYDSLFLSIGGLPSAGKVLTANSNGSATWQSASGGTVNLSYNSGTHAIDVSGGGTSATIPLSVADGSTLGLAAFASADFNSSSGVISLDYTNGQAATGSVKGFLTSADWTTFNSKLSSEVDGSITNEGLMTYTRSSDSLYQKISSNTSTSNNFWIKRSTGILFSSPAGHNDTLIISAVPTVSNTSSTNSLSTTVDGVTGSTVTIINSNALSSSVNTITSTINGVANSGTGTIINTNAVSSSTNTLTVTINGVANSGTGTLINSNTLSYATVSGILTSNLNGVSDTTLITVPFANITSIPTTLSGYGITDALSTSTSSTQDGYFSTIKLKDIINPSHYLTVKDSEDLSASRSLAIVMGDASRKLTFTADASIGGTHSGTSSGTNTGDQTITLTGNVTGSGTGSFATTIANNVVTGAMIAFGSDAQGDIAYYNGTDWVALTAGTSGKFLKTNGAGANPSWATYSLLASDTAYFIHQNLNAFGVPMIIGESDNFGITFKTNNITYARLDTSGNFKIGPSSQLSISNSVFTTGTDYIMGGSANGFTLNSTKNSTAAILLTTTGQDANSICIGMSNFTSTTIAKSAVNFMDTVTVASGTISYDAIKINNVFNVTGGSAIGSFSGIYFNPTFTSLAGLSSTYYGLYMPYSNANAYGIYQSGANTLNLLGGVTQMSKQIKAKEIAAPGTPASTFGYWYANSTDSHGHYVSDGGTDYDLILPALTFTGNVTGSGTANASVALTIAAGVVTSSMITDATITGADLSTTLTTAGNTIFGNSSNTLRLSSTSTSSAQAVLISSSGNNVNNCVMLGNTNFTTTSGNKMDFMINGGFAPTSGTGTFVNMQFTDTINQTGGANGMSCAIKIMPTLTAASDWRSIQIDNTSGYGIYQSSASVTNYFAGQTTFDLQEKLKAITAPGTPASGYGYLYEKSADKLLYFKNADSTEFGLTATQSIPVTLDGGGYVLTTGLKTCIEIPFACTITGWSITSTDNTSGSIVVDVWKAAYANLPATVSNTITGADLPTISSQIKGQNLTLSAWTTSVSAGDWLYFNINSVTSMKKISLSLRVIKN